MLARCSDLPKDTPPRPNRENVQFRYNAFVLSPPLDDVLFLRVFCYTPQNYLSGGKSCENSAIRRRRKLLGGGTLNHRCSITLTSFGRAIYRLQYLLSRHSTRTRILCRPPWRVIVARRSAGIWCRRCGKTTPIARSRTRLGNGRETRASSTRRAPTSSPSRSCRSGGHLQAAPAVASCVPRRPRRQRARVAAPSAPSFPGMRQPPKTAASCIRSRPVRPPSWASNRDSGWLLCWLSLSSSSVVVRECVVANK